MKVIVTRKEVQEALGLPVDCEIQLDVGLVFTINANDTGSVLFDDKLSKMKLHLDNNEWLQFIKEAREAFDVDLKTAKDIYDAIIAYTNRCRAGWK